MDNVNETSDQHTNLARRSAGDRTASHGSEPSCSSAELGHQVYPAIDEGGDVEYLSAEGASVLLRCSGDGLRGDRGENVEQLFRAHP